MDSTLEALMLAVTYISGCAILYCILYVCWDALAQRWDDWRDNRQFDQLKRGKK